MILSFDTSAPCVCAALSRGDDVLASAEEPMAKGQAERLMGLCQALLAQVGAEMSDLAAIGVGVGPGNFTGIRISVSAARGLALALQVPAIPISTFELMRDPHGIAAEAAELVSVAAPRDAAYVQPFRYGRPVGPAALIDPTAPLEHLRRVNLVITGHAAEVIAPKLGAEPRPAALSDTARRLAQIAAWKFQNGYDLETRPAPLYVKAPDAAPARDAPAQDPDMTPEALAALHRAAFVTERPWSAAEFAGLLDSPHVSLHAVDHGFALARSVAGEIELLTIAVDPHHQRQGIGRALVLRLLAEPGVESAFLEVAADNARAISLYEAMGFAEVGRRPAYYARKNAPRADAIVMQRALP